MKCKGAKDWFHCFAAKGAEFLWLLGSWVVKVILNFCTIIIIIPLAIIGWIKEKNE